MKSFYFEPIVLTILVMCSIARANEPDGDDKQGSASKCFQGILVTDQNNKISIEKSWMQISVSPCKQMTTTVELTTNPSLSTEQEMTTITNMASTERITSATPVKGMTTISQMTTVSHSSDGSTDLLSTTETTPSAAPVTTPTVPVTTPTVPVTTPTVPPAQPERKKRDLDPATEVQYYCQIFYYSNSDSSKVKVTSTSTLEFSCIQQPDDGCVSGPVEKTINGRNGTLYCCSEDNCNTPFLVINDKSVEVETVSNCISKGTESIPCLSGAHMCLNYTNGGSSAYMCGHHDIERDYCIEDNWYTERCVPSKDTEGTACCYLNGTPAPVNPTTTTQPIIPSKNHSQVTMVLFVSVAFIFGLVTGCVLLVCLQKKCKKRPIFDDMMDFSYSRFKSAESGADEL